MSVIAIEQAVYRREDGKPPHLIGHSPGFTDAWLPLAEPLVVGFGDRPAGVSCRAAVFARPLGKDRIAIVQVADHGPTALNFRILALPQLEYIQLLGDPFAVADRFPPVWKEPPPL